MLQPVCPRDVGSAGDSIDFNRRGDAVSANSPRNGQEVIRRLATIVDTYGAAIHISSFTHCVCGLGLGAFRRLALSFFVVVAVGEFCTNCF